MEYKTKDINIASVLLCYGANLVRVEKDINKDNKASFFVFTGNIDFEKRVKEYWADELLVNPKELLYKFKEVKNRLYTQ